MPLYVWSNPYPVRYGSSVVIARADTEDEARQKALKASISEYGYSPSRSIHVERPDLSGPPEFVWPDDEAICFEWSE